MENTYNYLDEVKKFSIPKDPNKRPVWKIWRRFFPKERNGVSNSLFYGDYQHLCHRWLKFEKFFEDVGPRPGNYSLIRLDKTKPWGPNNFRWGERETAGLDAAAEARAVNMCVLHLRGWSNQEIANKMGISPQLVCNVIAQRRHENAMVIAKEEVREMMELLK